MRVWAPRLKYSFKIVATLFTFLKSKNKAPHKLFSPAFPGRVTSLALRGIHESVNLVCVSVTRSIWPLFLWLTMEREQTEAKEANPTMTAPPVLDKGRMRTWEECFPVKLKLWHHNPSGGIGLTLDLAYPLLEVYVRIWLRGPEPGITGEFGSHSKKENCLLWGLEGA